MDALGALPTTSVYLDGTTSGWLNVGDITDRLIKAGVERADGFFLNASNYQFTTNLDALRNLGLVVHHCGDRAGRGAA